MKFMLVLAITAFPTLTNAQFFDLEDINKTMSAFELAFKENRIEFLEAISSEEFVRSDSYERLSDLTKKYSVNLGYTQTRCLKEFDIQSSLQKLLIRFIRKDNFWYVEDAYLQRGKELIDLPEKGFKPLAVEYNFSDFVNAVTSAEIEEFSGIAPFGKLPPSFFIDHKISKNQEAKVVISNIIFHDSKSIAALGYIAIKNYSTLIKNKRGWLLVEFGTMGDFYSRYMNKDLFLDFLLDKKGLVSYDLNKESPFFFANIANLKSAPTNGKEQVDKTPEPNDNIGELRLISVKVPKYKPDPPNPFFELELEFDGPSVLDETKIRIEIKTGLLECILAQSVKYIGSTHPKLQVETKDEKIIIRETYDSPFHFYAQGQMLGATIKKGPWSTRIVIKIALP